MAVASLLFLIVTLVWHDKIPSGLDPGEWHNFTKGVNEDLNKESARKSIIYASIFVHSAQTVLGFPLMHITKTLYGYILGTFRATILASMWEMFLVTGLTLFFEQYIKISEFPPVFKNLIKFVKGLRETDRVRFYVFVFCFQLSSIPLITAISFVLYKVISTRDFLVSHLFVTVFMSMKDAWLGNFIANSDANVKNVAVGTLVFVTSTCLPTLVSGVLLSHVFYFLKNNHAELLDDDEKKLLDELTLFEDLDCTKGKDFDDDTEVIDATEATETTKKQIEHTEDARSLVDTGGVGSDNSTQKNEQ